jgi:DNA-binding beta-propeller fold protein YncE
VYVTSLQTSTVLIFDTLHGNAELQPITGGGMNAPTSVTVDPSGNLYVTNWTTTVSVFDTLHGNAALPPIGGFGEPTTVIVH